MQCKSCKKIVPDTQFCIYCGTKLSQNECANDQLHKSQQRHTKPVPTFREQTASPHLKNNKKHGNSVDEFYPYMSEKADRGTRRGRGKTQILIISALILVFLVSMCTGLYLIVDGQRSDKKITKYVTQLIDSKEYLKALHAIEQNSDVIKDVNELYSTVLDKAIPTWYIWNAITVKENQLCYARTDFSTEDGTKHNFLHIMTYDDKGSLIDDRKIIFFDSENTARHEYNDAITNYNYEGFNVFSFAPGEAQYYIRNNTVVIVDNTFRPNISSLENAVELYSLSGCKTYYYDRLHNLATRGGEYSEYNGEWYSGQYHREDDRYEQTLNISFLNSSTLEFRYEKYKTLSFPCTASMKERGLVPFSINDAIIEISGWIKTEDGMLIMHIDKSSTEHLNAGEDYIFRNKRSLNPCIDGKYYANVISISENGIASVILKSQYTYDDDFISSLSNRSVINVDETKCYYGGYRAPGSYDGFTTLNPIYYFDINPGSDFHTYYISSTGLNGEWALYGPSDSPIFKEQKRFDLTIDSNVIVKDNQFKLYNGYYPEDSSINDLILRYGEDDFYSHTFELTIQNCHISEMDLVFMP